jgi:hypothetical protein
VRSSARTPLLLGTDRGPIVLGAADLAYPLPRLIAGRAELVGEIAARPADQAGLRRRADLVLHEIPQPLAGAALVDDRYLLQAEQDRVSRDPLPDEVAERTLAGGGAQSRTARR